MEPIAPYENREFWQLLHACQEDNNDWVVFRFGEVSGMVVEDYSVPREYDCLENAG